MPYVSSSQHGRRTEPCAGGTGRFAGLAAVQEQGLIGFVDSDAVEQVFKAGIAAHRIEEWVDFKEL
jgi:hypothetical protein